MISLVCFLLPACHWKSPDFFWRTALIPMLSTGLARPLSSRLLSPGKSRVWNSSSSLGPGWGWSTTTGSTSWRSGQLTRRSVSFLLAQSRNASGRRERPTWPPAFTEPATFAKRRRPPIVAQVFLCYLTILKTNPTAWNEPNNNFT